MTVSFLRHSGWVTPQDLSSTLNIVGCGAVGSHIATTAAKMGFHSFRLFDFDTVESHNLPNQAYDLEHVGMLKVDALEAVLRRFNPSIEVEKHYVPFETIYHKGLLRGPLIISTDSMKSRADLYNAFALNFEIDVVAEVRLGFDFGEVSLIDNLSPSACRQWKETLLRDEDVPDGPCNKRICTTLVQITSAYVVHSICSKYAASRQGISWEYDSRKLFSLDSKLNAYTMA